jgi:antitoxin component YwqK of YwqJK toxin-antitoxin module
MKILSLVSLLLLLASFCGCGDSTTYDSSSDEISEEKSVEVKASQANENVLQDAVDFSKLQNRNQVAFLPNTEVPFSGFAKRLYRNEQVELLIEIKQGYVVSVKQWMQNGIPRAEFQVIPNSLSIDKVPFEISVGNASGFEEIVQSLHLRLTGDAKFCYENGQVGLEGSFANGRAQGELKIFHANGQVAFAANMIEGQRDGLVEYWYENGQRRSSTYFKSGQRSGLHESWFSNGIKSIKSNYSDDNRDGQTVIRYESGAIQKEAFYRNGTLAGLVKEFYEDGTPKSENNYLGGLINGTSKEWREDGTLIYKAGVEKGSVISVERMGLNGEPLWIAGFKAGAMKVFELPFSESEKLDENLLNGIFKKFSAQGKAIIEGTYANGKKNGAWTYFGRNRRSNVVFDQGVLQSLKEWDLAGESLKDLKYVDGKISDGFEIIHYPNSNQKSRLERYKDGVFEGLQTTWYENGKKKSESNYKNGEIDGTQTTWHESGRKELESSYKSGVKDGKSIYYNELGEVQSVKRWKDNEVVAAEFKNIPSSMKQRFVPRSRLVLINKFGGSSQIENSVSLGLSWLKKVQDSDGGWGRQDKDDMGENTGGYPEHRDAMTAMALLAFLGHGELQDSADYGEVVRTGIEFLTSSPPDKSARYDDAGKFLGFSTEGNRLPYSHAIRTYALCESYTIMRSTKLKEFVQKAVKVILDGQHSTGGWAYGYSQGLGAHVDLSLTGWCIQALKAFSITEIKDPNVNLAMSRAIDYVRKSQDGEGRFKYTLDKSKGSNSLTGTGAFSLQIWETSNSRELTAGLDYIAKERLQDDWKKVDPYECYYNTLACFQSMKSGQSKYWEKWNPILSNVLLRAQMPDGHWPTGKYFHGDSDIFRTTLAILSLEVYYRYAFL